MSAFSQPIVRPLRRDEVALEVDRATGEVLGWRGLNEDPERCPGEWCGSCTASCFCAPCRCAECLTRFTLALALAPDPQPRLVLL